MNLPRPVAVAGSAVVLALSLSGCFGDDSQDPAATSVEDFCAALSDLEESSPPDDASQGERVEFMLEQADELGQIDPPEAMPDDARAGFEIFVRSLKSLADAGDDAFGGAEADEELMESLQPSDAELEDVRAFFEYRLTECDGYRRS